MEKHGLQYEEGIPFSEDHFFIQLYLLHAHSVSLIPKFLYHYRRTDSSATMRFVAGDAPAFHYECAVNLLPRVADYFPESMGVDARRMWYTALFTQNFHQIYLVKHVLKGKKHPEAKRINASVWQAFWKLFRHTPKLAACRIIVQDALRLVRRMLNR